MIHSTVLQQVWTFYDRRSYNGRRSRRLCNDTEHANAPRDRHRIVRRQCRVVPHRRISWRAAVRPVSARRPGTNVFIHRINRYKLKHVHHSALEWLRYVSTIANLQQGNPSRTDNAQRLGRLDCYLQKQNGCLEKSSSRDTPAVLDIKWCNHTLDGRATLAVADASGSLDIYSLGVCKTLCYLREHHRYTALRCKHMIVRLLICCRRKQRRYCAEADSESAARGRSSGSSTRLVVQPTANVGFLF